MPVSVTQAEFARLCGVNRSSVSRAIKRQRLATYDGLISLNPADSTKDALVNAAKTLWSSSASSDPHHQARLQQLEEERAHKKTGTGGASVIVPIDHSDSIEAINKRIKLADAVKRENEARTYEINRLALEGEYLEKESVDYALRQFTAVFRRELENLSDRLTPIVFHLESVEEVKGAIAKAAEDIQREVNASMEKSIKEAK